MKFTRREFSGLAAAGVAGGCAATQSEPTHVDDTSLPIIPAHAKRVPTACDYCIVGCGYEAITWPVEDRGTDEDPADWYAPAMHTIADVDGRPHHVVVRPDRSSRVVNVGGDFSVRGGTLAQKLYSKDRATRERLTTPLLRVDGELVPIGWDEALEINARVGRYVLDRHGELAWGMKHYSYQYYENTYALTKLALGAVNTPVWAVHDKPAEASDTPGLSDAGVYAFNASYQDWRDAEVIFVSGVSLYDAKSILFQDWVAPGGAKLIVVNPRRDLTASYALANGGLHLQVVPGTDTLLHNAIARQIIEMGGEDAAFIAARTVSAEDLAGEGGFRRAAFGRTYEDYRAFILGRDEHRAEAAAEITGVPAEQIRAAAQMLAAPAKSAFMLEKGNYWSHNVDNTNSFVSLGLLVGAGGAPGRVIGRAGGHQRGMIKGGRYPHDKSPDHYEGHPLALNVDRWVTEGRVRYMWVVGTTWCAAMGATGHLDEVISILTRHTGPQMTSAVMRAGRVDVEAAVDALRAKVDALGMVLVQQDIYANGLSAYADLVFPAAGWGEADFTRMQGERRLRMYSRIADAPGDARPDWWIVAQTAQRMGYEGFDWPDGNAIFEEAAEASVGSPHDYQALVDLARERGESGHEFLRALGTEGVQCPIRRDGDALVGTPRLHDERFFTTSGRAVFMEGSWARVAPVQERIAPRGDELWVTNMRVNALWQSLADDARIPQRIDRYPANVVHIHPADAAARGIATGDWVSLENDSVLNHQGQPHLGRVRAVALVTDSTRRGVMCTYFNYRGDVSQSANCLTDGEVDPMNPVYRYKLARARVVRLGRSEFAETMVRHAPNRV
ncbi:MAG: arsenate reductase (azurin) large subunit [Deltaproteobacteria bacterium]|jgi:arsenite oxidase large subunit